MVSPSQRLIVALAEFIRDTREEREWAGALDAEPDYIGPDGQWEQGEVFYVNDDATANAARELFYKVAELHDELGCRLHKLGALPDGWLCYKED